MKKNPGSEGEGARANFSAGLLRLENQVVCAYSKAVRPAGVAYFKGRRTARSSSEFLPASLDTMVPPARKAHRCQNYTAWC